MLLITGCATTSLYLTDLGEHQHFDFDDLMAVVKQASSANGHKVLSVERAAGYRIALIVGPGSAGPPDGKYYIFRVMRDCLEITTGSVPCSHSFEVHGVLPDGSTFVTDPFMDKIRDSVLRWAHSISD